MNKLFLFGFSMLIVGAGCKTPKNSLAQNQPLPAFDAEGHRGSRGLMPENTIPAMFKAIDLGVTTIEMDSHITSDGKVVVAHDHHINPSFALKDGKEIPKKDAKKYAIYQLTYNELKKFDVGSKYHDLFPQQKKQHAQIPLLSELIDSVQTYLKANNKKQVFYNIETKSDDKGDNLYHPAPEAFVKSLMDVIQSKKITPWVIIQSFDIRTLQVLNKQYPGVRTSLLVSKGTLDENLEQLGFVPAIYSPNAKLVTAELIKACHAKNMKVIPWTVNTREEIDALKRLGVDGIISDYPNLFVQN